MKYAITGPKGRVFQILDEQRLGAVEISDDLAATISASEAPLYLIEGELKTQEEFIDLQRVADEASRIETMTPEELAMKQARDEAQAIYNAAVAAFEAMPKGKQLLWEPVRQGVAAAIMRGDMTEALEILNTTPVIYEGAEDDRATFLALF